jgi:thioredoxin-related protein
MLLTVAAPAPVAAHSVATPSAAHEDHGKIAWYQGSFDDAVREATRTKKIIFIDFWTSWCVWCKRLDADTFSNDAVADAMKDVLCYSVDAESADGAPLAKKFAAKGYPTLIFLDPDGALRDRIGGYLAADAFLKELKRIKSGDGTLSDARARLAKSPNDVFARLDLVLALRKLNDPSAQTELEAAKKSIAHGEGFDAKSLDDRWKLSQKLATLGDAAASREQLDAIKTFDPECKSIVCRRLKLQEISRDITRNYRTKQTVDTSPLIAFLNSETEPTILFDGWCTLQDWELFQVKDARKYAHADQEQFHMSAARDAGKEAWKYCPADKVADWGGRFAASLYQEQASLKPEEKDLAVDVATRAFEAAPKSLDHLEVLACCLFAAGKHDESIVLLKRGLEQDPQRAALKKRLDEFQH